LGAEYFAPKPLNLANLVYFISDVSLKEGKTAENLVKIPEHNTEITTSLLIVDDDPLTLKTLIKLLEDYFRENRTPFQLLTAETYRQAVDLLNSHYAELDYVLSDLHIDSNADGLLLANKTLELNNQTNRDIQFFVFTHANVDRLNKTISRSRVKGFYRHPISVQALKDIFGNEHPVEFCRTITGNRDNTPDSEVESYSLPVLIKLMNKNLLRQTRRIISHNIAGELEMMKQNLFNDIKEEGGQKVAVNRLLPTLPEVAEQLQSFLDIIRYSDDMQNLKYLFIVPFNLKFFVERFIEKQTTTFQQALNGIQLVNNIGDSGISVVGDETIFQKVVHKVFLNVVASFINHEKNGTIIFSTFDNAEKQTLQMTCDIFDEEVSEETMNQLFQETPFVHSHANLDFTACGYLMSLHNGQVSVMLDHAKKTTSYCFTMARGEEQQTYDPGHTIKG
jgi:CheY-like chemotaxis protein